MYGYGIEGSGASTGVSGYSDNTGVFGSGSTGVEGTGSTYGVRGYSTSGVALYARTDSGSGNIIEAWSSGSERVFRVERGGDVRADGSFTGGGADFAELLPGAVGLEPGDVLVIGPDGRLARSTEPYQSTVAGIYSTQPGFLGGAGEDADLSGKIPLAVVGVVPVKASAENGSIQPGNLLTASSTPGHAMKAGSNPTVGTVIGKALGGLSEGTSVISMLVMLQ